MESAAPNPKRSRILPTIRVSTTPSFAEYWLVSCLAILEGNPPDLRLEITAEPHLADIASGNADIAIRYGRGKWKMGYEEMLFPEFLYPTLSSSLFKKGTNLDLLSLTSLPLLHDGDTTKWKAWFHAQGLPFQYRPSDRVFPTDALTMSAALNGLGVALLSKQYDWSSKSNLVWVNEKQWGIASPFNYYLITPSKPKTRKLSIFIDRLREEARRFQAGPN